MADQRIGLYPGTFDPITNGHIDIIRRAVKLVDRLVIGVAINAGKGPLFSLEERVAMVEQETASLWGDGGPGGDGGPVIDVRPFDCLLMHFAERVGAQIIIRGLRAVSDFEYEFQMVGMNARLNPNVETVFLMAEARYQAIASRLVKEIAVLGGDIAPFVPQKVAKMLVKRAAEQRAD
jgi:pantetheine-phosphate adenylyltransferase